jgi:ubiquinone biosynthesis protein COQ4
VNNISSDATSEAFRVRINVRRAIACAPGALNPVDRHEQFLELIMAMAGPGFQKSYDRFRNSPDGKELLEHRPNLTDVLLDVDRLRASPPGSLGHAYLDFMSHNRLDAALYGDSLHDLPAIGERLGWDDDFRYVIDRGIATHDLMHVLGGYGPDVGGELGVLGFTHGQTGGLATGATVGMVLALPLGVGRRERLRWWREAVLRGRTADLLFAVPYEELMERPIDEVRRSLWIRPSHQAHPHGHLYSGYQFGTKNTRWMDSPYAPYEYDPQRDLTDVEMVGV